MRDQLIETVQMRGHNICFDAELTKTILIITKYSLLSRALFKYTLSLDWHKTFYTGGISLERNYIQLQKIFHISTRTLTLYNLPDRSVSHCSSCSVQRKAHIPYCA